MHPRDRFPSLLPLSIGYYLVLALSASVLGSYRYESSGVQYVALPMVFAPLCAVVATALTIRGARATAPIALSLLPWASTVVLALPALGMVLSNRNLEIARWALIFTGVAHAGGLALFARRVRKPSNGARPA